MCEIRSQSPSNVQGEFCASLDGRLRPLVEASRRRLEEPLGLVPVLDREDPEVEGRGPFEEAVPAMEKHHGVCPEIPALGLAPFSVVLHASGSHH